MSSSQRPESSSTPPTPQRSTIYFNKVPSIRILVPPKGGYTPNRLRSCNSYGSVSTGRYSTKPDEHCFTYCSQSVRGRIDQAEPWCRSFCIRRIFDHEVRRTLAVQGQNKQSPAQTASTDAQFPLPPEGQPSADAHRSSTQSSEGDEWDEGMQWTPSVSSGGPSSRDMRYWKTGWYFWYSKSRWAAQEKMDLMMCDLAKQAEWQKYKEKMNAEWAEQEQKARAIGELAAEDLGTQAKQATIQPPVQIAPSAPSAATAVIEAPLPPQVGPPFPEIASDSILLPIPPPLTAIEVPLRNLFAPTVKLLTMTHQTVTSGQQTKLVQKLWETTYTSEPWKLARNSVMKVYQALKENASSEDDAKRDRNS
ncbi:hypothetical protein EIP86_003788 [Pleurotus ostreatoroseus]|nr:hypothetical protein EIP86_003788 [Pleurotus ostreatoroseus]